MCTVMKKILGILFLSLFATLVYAGTQIDKRFLPITEAELRQRVVNTPCSSLEHSALISRASISHLSKLAYHLYTQKFKQNPRDAYANLWCGNSANTRWWSIAGIDASDKDSEKGEAQETYKVARKRIMAAYHLSPKSPVINAQMGYQMWKDSSLGENDTKGIALIEKALILDPHNAYAHFLLGKIYQTPAVKTYDSVRSQNELFKSLQLDPGYAQAHYALAVTYRDEHQYPEAQKELDAFRAMTPDLPASYTAFIQGQINAGLRK